MKQLLFKTVDMAWRVLVVAIGYTLSLVIAGMILGMLGLLPVAANAEMDATAVFQQMFVGGLVMSLILGLVARQLPASPARHILIWSVLLFANIGSVIIEGYFFVPDLVTNLWVTLAQQLLPCLVTAALVYWLFAPQLAIWSGLLLFIVGGIVPLTWQMTALPLPLLLASAVEIFCQNFTTGVVTALLLVGKMTVPAAPRLRYA